MATFAEQMVEKLQAILLANAGLASVSVDGTMVAQADLEAKLAHWQGKLSRAGNLLPAGCDGLWCVARASKLPALRAMPSGDGVCGHSPS